MARLTQKLSQHTNRNAVSGNGMALLSERDTLTEIPLTHIEPDPEQPRRNLGDLSELAASIKELGVIQPIIVSIVAYERYCILAGERRFSASKLAGLVRIPAIVRSVSDHRRLELQLVENLHRKDLDPFEEASGYQRLLEEFSLSHDELGRRLGKSQVSVTESLRLLELPETIREEAHQSGAEGKKVSKSLLLEIARRPEAEQRTLWQEARQGRMTVKQARASRRGVCVRSSAPTGGRGLRYPIALVGQNATVTIEFASFRPSVEEIVAALEEALGIERARLPHT